ncbi:integrase, catalytic region, zinc finger, CCHC-type containing protein [Tanacetum coccineum]
MQIPAWMITDEMKLTEHYRMYAEVFGIDVPLTQSQQTESTQGTHRTPSAPRSPNPDKEVAESSAPRRSTKIHLRLPERRSTRLTPLAPVPTVDKADEMILKDTLQYSSIPRNDESNIPGTRIEPRSDKESPEVEIAKEKEVEISKEKEVELTTHAYADVRSQNQELLMTISELRAKLKNVRNGLSTNSSVRRPSSRDLSFKTSVVSNTKNSSEEVEVSDRTNKKPDVASKNVALNTFVTNDEIKNALIAKNVLCVTCAINVVQIFLWIVDSGCSKHMTGDRSLLKNFVEKFMGTVCFGNDHFVAITCYEDYVQGNIMICHVYFVEGLGHNLFSVGQSCDGELEVDFRSQTCYVRNLEGDDMLTEARESNLYTISIPDMAASSPVCLISKASSTKSWLWHRRLSHLNFGTINYLTKLDLVDSVPKFKYRKDHLCSTCEWGKSKKTSHPPKVVPSTHSKLELLHMDLCSLMRVASINGKKYILGRKPNVEYFHVFGLLCYPKNDRDDLGKMKPKADIGIFTGYSKTSRGFRIYNQRTKKIMETIHVKFDELTAMASEHHSLEPVLQCSINDDSSAESMNTPSKEDLDNLFGPMFDEYFEKKSSDMPIKSAAPHVHNYEDLPCHTPPRQKYEV